MQYGQIVFLLFIAFLFYYAVLIVLDIQKAKMAQAAEQENHTEEEIDISKNRTKGDTTIPITVKPS